MKATCLNALIYTLLLLSSPVSAASFACKKASTHVEKMICSTPMLGTKDEDLHDQYTRLLLSSDDQGKVTIRNDQRRWLKQRAVCKRVSCLQEIYEQRSEELTSAQNTKVFYSASNESKEALNTNIVSKFSALKNLIDVTTRGNPESEDGLSWETQLKLWEVNAHYLVVHESSWLYSKGDAHPFESDRYRTIERNTGKILDDGMNSPWLMGAFSAEDQSLIRSAYLRHFGSGSDEDGGCGGIDEDEFVDVIDTVPSNLGLGLIQETAHVNRACAGPFFISWRQAKPFLTAYGVKLMEIFQK